jgi:hypothetical protein
MRREAQGADQQPTEAELALVEERRQLKEQRGERQAQALQPKPSAIDRLVRTHRAQPNDKPKAGEEARSAKEAKKKAHRSRAEKHAEKAAAMQAARRPPKKPAK